MSNKQVTKMKKTATFQGKKTQGTQSPPDKFEPFKIYNSRNSFQSTELAF